MLLTFRSSWLLGVWRLYFKFLRRREDEDFFLATEAISIEKRLLVWMALLSVTNHFVRTCPEIYSFRNLFWPSYFIQSSSYATFHSKSNSVEQSLAASWYSFSLAVQFEDKGCSCFEKGRSLSWGDWFFDAGDCRPFFLMFGFVWPQTMLMEMRGQELL